MRRRVFLSHPHGVGVVTISADCPAGLDVSIALGSLLRVTGSGASPGGAWMTLRLPADVWPTHDELGEPVRYSDEPGESLEGAVALSWRHDGRAGTTGASTTGVHEATIMFSTRTTFAGIARPPRGSGAEALAQARERVSVALADGVDSVRRSQRADHAALFDRVRISTGPAPTADLPIDARLRRGNANPDGVLRLGPALAGLLYNFGRYLLISSSRAGGVPANLQGIWNDLLQPPWSSNYTTNINLEMNYWPAEVANLSELATPLFDLIEGLTVTGAETARRVYGAPGWVAHHNTDPWAYSQPAGGGRGDPRWGFWPLAGAWLVRHLWEHLLFGSDDDFARRALPPIRSAAEFFLYWLVEFPDGSLGTSPSTSPENGFVQAGDGDGTVDASSTMDLVLIADLVPDPGCGRRPPGYRRRPGGAAGGGGADPHPWPGAGARRDDPGVARRPSAVRSRAPSSLAPLFRVSGRSPADAAASRRGEREHGRSRGRRDRVVAGVEGRSSGTAPAAAPSERPPEARPP